MTAQRRETKSGRNTVFYIQLLECFMVAVLLNLAFCLAGKLIYSNSFPFGFIDGILMYSIMSALAVIMLGANRYFSFISRPTLETLSKIFGLIVMMNFIFIALLYFSWSIRLSFYYFIVVDALQLLFLLLIKRFTYLLKTSTFKNRISLVIGKNRDKNQLIRELGGKTLGKLAFVSYEDVKLKEYVDKANNVFISGVLSKKLKDQIINYCILKDKKIFIVPETYEIAMRKAEMTQIGDIPLFAIESFRLSEAQSIIKRFLDVLLSLTGIVISFPIMIYAALRIKLEDGGPVFYRQIRSGLNGKPFQVIKFRSMVVDAEKHTGAVFASDNDSRITTIGSFMRRARIDEIPQFFNVLAGSMSIVGPRPERPVFVEEFSKEFPEYVGRLAVKPGITGLAQVMGNYTTSAENKIKFDLVYIREYSLLLDIKILLRTVHVVFSKEKAEGFSSTPDSSYNLEDLATGETAAAIRPSAFKNHRIGKTILAACCCLIIIAGSIFLRYSTLAVTMIEAASQQKEVVEVAEVESSEKDTTPLDQEEPVDNAGIDTQNQITTASMAAPVQGVETLAPDLLGEEPDSKTYYHSPEETAVSKDEINTALGKMPFSDRLEITYQLLSRLDAKDLIILEKLAEDGFTADEKAIAKEMMYRYYNDVEIEYIKEVYWEYME